MNEFEIAGAVMEAVEIHATRSCSESMRRLERVLEVKEDGFEAAWILAARLVSHTRATGGDALALAVPGFFAPPVMEAVQLISVFVAAAGAEDRATAERAWEHASLLVRCTATLKMFHLSVDMGAWTREARA